MTLPLDPVALTQDLVRLPSITPREAGTLDLLERHLAGLGFTCRRYPFGEGLERVDNLYARRGTSAPIFCFAGHVDVVPTGDDARWSAPPFSADIRDGQLWGRGAADMKGAIAAMLSAVARTPEHPGSISFLITGDEEGPAKHGTEPLLQAITADGEAIDHCLVGEPTNPERLGTTIKNGRRGSFNCVVTATGRQGHVAYPHLAANPVRVLLDFLHTLQARELDQGNAFFQPSNLEVTSLAIPGEGGNPAHNVIPETATARFNIRFNTEHRGAQLEAWARDLAERISTERVKIELAIRITGEAFLTDPSPFTSLVQDAVEAATGLRPELSTAGGTSDARYITRYAPVVEFGLVGATMHQVDERVDVSDIRTLADIYTDILARYFVAYSGPPTRGSPPA